MTKPWHDTVMHEGCGGPIVPQQSGIPPHLCQDFNAVFCAACGLKYHEADPGKLARIWWSAGAWAGREETQAEVSR